MIQDVPCPRLYNPHLVPVFKPQEDRAGSQHLVVLPVGTDISVETSLVQDLSVPLELVLVGRESMVGGEGEHVETGCIGRNGEETCLPVQNLHGTVLTTGVLLLGTAVVWSGYIEDPPLLVIVYVASIRTVVGDQTNPF